MSRTILSLWKTIGLEARLPDVGTHASQEIDVATVVQSKPIASARGAGSGVRGRRRSPSEAQLQLSETKIRSVRSGLHDRRSHGRHRARDLILRQPAIGAC